MNDEFPYRQKVYGCIHPETYKYFFRKEDVSAMWKRLCDRYGELAENKPFLCMQIDGEFLILRSTLGGNPITVIRKRGCKRMHIDELHALLGFKERSA